MRTADLLWAFYHPVPVSSVMAKSGWNKPALKAAFQQGTDTDRAGTLGWRSHPSVRPCVSPVSHGAESHEEYVQEEPQQAGFFFAEKKGGRLRLCIDYRGLNQFSVKYPHPLPLVPSALKQLCTACIFTKLDLWSAKNPVHTGDEWKVVFSTTSRHYEYTTWDAVRAFLHAFSVPVPYKWETCWVNILFFKSVTVKGQFPTLWRTSDAFRAWSSWTDFHALCAWFPCLPSPLPLAEMIINHIFHYNVILEDSQQSSSPIHIQGVVKPSFLDKLAVSLSLSSSYHPHVNQEISHILRRFCAENQNDWAFFLSWAKCAQTHCATLLPASLSLMCIMTPATPVPMECQPHWLLLTVVPMKWVDMGTGTPAAGTGSTKV